jgi:hypothetical protein
MCSLFREAVSIRTIKCRWQMNNTQIEQRWNYDRVFGGHRAQVSLCPPQILKGQETQASTVRNFTLL